MAAVSVHVQWGPLKGLDPAFKHCFRRGGKKEKPGGPGSVAQADLTGWAGSALSGLVVASRHVRCQAVGQLRVHRLRPISAPPTLRAAQMTRGHKGIFALQLKWNPQRKVWRTSSGLLA